MAGNGRIVTLGSGEDAAVPDAAGADAPSAEPAAEPEAAPPARGGGSAAALALLAVAAWSGFFAYARLAAPPPASPADWAALVSTWASPVLLVGVAWLLALRTSRREAGRFGDAARALATESARLEDRLRATNRELSLAREFIGAQARDLDALGRLASERLSESAGGLQQLIALNAARLETVGGVSRAALDNMERLRGQLPVIANLAKDVTNQIGNAGRTASEQLDALHDGLRRLDAAGGRVGEQVDQLDGAVAGALAEFTRQCDTLGDVAETRFVALGARGAAFRRQLEAHEEEALAAIRARAGALAGELEGARARQRADEAAALGALRARVGVVADEGAALSARLGDAQTNAVERWREAIARLEGDLDEAQVSLARREADALAAGRERIDALGDRLEAIDGEIAARREGHARQSAALATLGEAIAGKLAASERRLAEIVAHGGEVEARVSAGLDALGARLDAGRATLEGSDAQLAGLIAASTRLLGLLDASTARARDDLPCALASGSERIEAVDAASGRIVGAVADAGARGERLADLLGAAASALAARFGEVEARQGAAELRAAEHAARLAAASATLGDIEARGERLVEHARDELTRAIAELGDAADGALARINDAAPAAANALARQFAQDSTEAIARVARLGAAEAAGRIEHAAAHAAGAGRAAAEQLRAEVAEVDALAEALEARVAAARARAEDRHDDRFARRAALIRESLNAHAVDLAGALEAEVSDAAWAAYLRGDRGVFARRAVRLLGGGERRAVATLYRDDAAFREAVSRYVADFEAMLREVLSTHDGQALGVTLISSDLGKLYVALAQSIERLRA